MRIQLFVFHVFPRFWRPIGIIMAPSLASLFLLQACGLALADGLQPHLCAPRRRNHPSDVRMDLAAIHRVVAVGEEQVLLKVVYDTECTEGSSTLPCVAFLSGADCPHESYMWLATRLARAGCAVALSTSVVSFGHRRACLRLFDMGHRRPSTPTGKTHHATGSQLCSMNCEHEQRRGGPLFESSTWHGAPSAATVRRSHRTRPGGFRQSVRLGAVFSYGASLVTRASLNSRRGSILPRRTPPPSPPTRWFGGWHLRGALAVGVRQRRCGGRSLRSREGCRVRGAVCRARGKPHGGMRAGRSYVPRRTRRSADGTRHRRRRGAAAELTSTFSRRMGCWRRTWAWTSGERCAPRYCAVDASPHRHADPVPPSRSRVDCSSEAHEEGGAEGEAIRPRRRRRR